MIAHEENRNETFDSFLISSVSTDRLRDRLKPTYCRSSCVNDQTYEV